MNHNSIHHRSIDEIQHHLLQQLFAEGDEITTRGNTTLELCNVHLTLENPRARSTRNPARKWSRSLAIGELAWHLSASDSLEAIAYYAKVWKEFSNDGRSISQSCYGNKIFKLDQNGNSQWTRLVQLLKQDSQSRRAVLDLYDAEGGLDASVKDVACTCSVQFLIRKGALDAIVTMRSNDLIWGLPYDFYLFTMLQEMLAQELGVHLGRYHHNVGSLHLYERHWDLGREMLDAPVQDHLEDMPMGDIQAVPDFLRHERGIRENRSSTAEIEALPLDPYWKSMLVHLAKVRDKRHHAESKALLQPA